jgi:sporulation protein YabP
MGRKRQEVIFMAEKEKKENIVQNLNIEGRERLFISGVNEVVCFDEHMIDVKTELGRLVVRGEGLKLITLDPEIKELKAAGYVYSCEYEDGVGRRKGFFRGMTR